MRSKSTVAGWGRCYACIVFLLLSAGVYAQNTTYTFSSMPEVLPGTQQLTMQGDLSAQMLEGAHRLIDNQISRSQENRAKLWKRDLSSRGAYELSVEPNRKRFRKYIGIEDTTTAYGNYNLGLPDRRPAISMQRFSDNGDPELVAETSRYRVYQVRWPVLNKIYGEGLLLQPKSKAVANIIALPDADQTPEQLAGLAPGIPAGSQFARHLAENGFQVLVPVLISRKFIFEGKPEQQTYRERIYRQAYHMGRHLIGFEVHKVLSAVDWFKQSAGKDVPVGVAGYNEGGLIAFYAAAVDKRIASVMVSGYFSSRERVWDEPLYRNVWGLLTEFGDAEIASLIAPRPLVVEYSKVPKITEKIEAFVNKPTQVERFPFTGYKGTIETSRFEDVQTEFSRIDKLLKPGFQSKQLISNKNSPTDFGSHAALVQFARSLGIQSKLSVTDDTPSDRRSSFSTEQRQFRQVKEMEDHVQALMHVSGYERNKFFLYRIMPEWGQRRWSTAAQLPVHSPDKFIEQAKEYRNYFWQEVLGKFEEPMLAPNPRTRRIYDREKWTGYEVVLDVYNDLIAPAVLLIPKDIKPGEKRPVVVCQHGRNGLPKSVIEGNTSYYDMAAKLADQGFVVYVTNGIFRGEDQYRWLDRKVNALKKTLFSFVLSQHDQALRWLGSLSFTDKSRIAFYGKSYGGETAMRVPSVLEGYALSISSGDFGDWTRKVVDTQFSNGFMNSLEWEMPYFNMGSTNSYAEMAYLIFPRPFMVERGHDDLVQPDEWVAYEYAKVKYLYDKFGLGDKTEIEFFNGGHASRNEGTFKFLHRHLHRP